MSSLLYFLPGQVITVLSPEVQGKLLKDFKLEDVLGGASLTPCGIQHGPKGLQGTLISVQPVIPGEESVASYVPDQQTWLEGPGYWLGHWNGLEDKRRSKPRPEDLARDRTYGSYAVRIADKQPYNCPVVPADLPKRFLMTVIGPQMVEEEGLSWLTELGQKWQDIRSGILPSPPIVEIATDVIRVLGFNYRIGLWEASLLRIIDSTAAATIVAVCILDETSTSQQEDAEKKGVIPQPVS